MQHTVCCGSGLTSDPDVTMDGSMVVILTIAVLALTVALLLALVFRRPQERAEPDLAPALQQAASQAMADLQRMNEESRKIDAQASEATLDKRQAEIKALAERIAKGQKTIEAEVRRRGEVDLETRTLLEQMGQTIGNLNSETAGLKRPSASPRPAASGASCSSGAALR